MRPQAITLGTTMMLLISTLAFAQSRTQGHDPDQHNDRLFARLSYSSGHIVDWRQEQGNPQICFALYRSGYYRVSRLTERGTETLQGTLSEDQVLRFRGMLEKSRLPIQWGRRYSHGAEVFIAEVVRNAKPCITSGSIPTTSARSPNSAMSVVKWLQDFNRKAALRSLCAN